MRRRLITAIVILVISALIGLLILGLRDTSRPAGVKPAQRRTPMPQTYNPVPGSFEDIPEIMAEIERYRSLTELHQEARKHHDLPITTQDDPRYTGEKLKPYSYGWIFLHQNDDGSWGDGDVSYQGYRFNQHGATALVLLSLLGAGYTHLSKDHVLPSWCGNDVEEPVFIESPFDPADEDHPAPAETRNSEPYPYEGHPLQGVSYGERIKAAYKWLLQNEATTDPLNDAIVALALSEAYGMTGSPLFKDQAQQKVGQVQDLQRPDGSWSGDPLLDTMGTMVLKSADISGLTIETKQLTLAGEHARRNFGTWGDPMRMSAYILANGSRKDPGLSGSAALAVQTLPTGATYRPIEEYVIGLGLFRYDGPNGKYWKSYGENLKQAVVEQIDESERFPNPQSRTAQAVKYSFLQQALSLYYRYDNHFCGGGH